MTGNRIPRPDRHRRAATARGAHLGAVGIAAAMLGACTAAPERQIDPARLGLQPPPDTCGAGRYAALIGQPHSAAPDPKQLSPYRLASDRDPITEDYNPARLNIFYDSKSGRIIGIRCF